MKKTADLPPCPDPERYLLVKTREGMFWRKKRGQGEKGARLNEKFQASAAGMAVTAPAAKRIVTTLRPYLDGISPGRLTVRISGRLRKEYNASGSAGYRHLEGFSPAADHPLEKLLAGAAVEMKEDRQLQVGLDHSGDRIKAVDAAYEHYWFELIIINGDCTMENGLNAVSVKSEVYQPGLVGAGRCELSLQTRASRWFALLKICCGTNGSDPVAAMRVVAVNVL